MTVKMLQRKASLEAGESREAPPEQDVPLSVPKKTRLYIEQTQREREQERWTRWRSLAVMLVSSHRCIVNRR